MSTTTEERCALYRHYDEADELLYVGISVTPEYRGRNHAKSSHWIAFAARQEAEWLPNRGAAKAAEAAAIRRELPIFNVVGAGPDRERRVVEYLVRRGRLDLLAPAPVHAEVSGSPASEAQAEAVSLPAKPPLALAPGTRSVDDPVALAKAARIVRAALARQRITMSDLARGAS